MTNAPDRPANPFVNFGQQGSRRMGGEKTPATTNPVTSRCSALRITVERGKGYQSYRFLAAGSFVYFPVDLNELFKPLVGDLRPEDDLKVNWTITWFMNAQARRIVTKIADTTTGEILAQTDAQPALIETTVDEKTGQLTTAKQKLDPFGKPIDPLKVAMRNLVNAARGNENDYDYRADANDYDAERNKYMGIDTQPLVAAAITQGKDDPNPTPSPDEPSTLDEHFGPKAKAPGEVTTLTDDEMKESLRMKYREGLGRDMTVADFERATEWKRLEDARYADKGALTDAEIMKMVEADIAAQKKIALEAHKTVEIEVKATPIPETTNEPPVAAPVSVEKSKPAKTVALVPTGDSKWDVMTQKAQVMIRSGFMPEAIKTADQVLTIAMMGEALDIDPIVAVNNINVIKGKPTVSPQLMLALVRRSKQLEDFSVVDDGSTCTVTMKRKGETVHVEKFSMEDAQRMKTTEWENNTKKTISLSEKHNWRQQPAVMRKWRAISAACRVVFPDIIWGLYTTEEIDPDVIVVEAA